MDRGVVPVGLVTASIWLGLAVAGCGGTPFDRRSTLAPPAEPALGNGRPPGPGSVELSGTVEETYPDRSVGDYVSLPEVDTLATAR
jgi:hypothetical protein